MSFEYPEGPEAERALRDLANKREQSAKRRMAEVAARGPLLKAAREKYEKQLARTRGLGGSRAEIEGAAAFARYQQSIDEISGVAEARRRANSAYREIHGHNPDPEYTRRDNSSGGGGMGSAAFAIRESLRQDAARINEEMQEEREPAFHFEFRGLEMALRPWIVEMVRQRPGLKSVLTQVEHKSFVALKSTVVNAQSGLLDTYFSVTNNVDRGNDRIIPGAFERVISQIKNGQKPWPVLLYGHQTDSLSAVMGSIVDLEELRPGDPRLPQRLLQNGWGAVRARARFNLNTQAGRDGYALASAGDLPSWSFAYVPGDFEFVGKSGSAIRELRIIEELLECSMVVTPMNEAASGHNQVVAA